MRAVPESAGMASVSVAYQANEPKVTMPAQNVTPPRPVTMAPTFAHVEPRRGASTQTARPNATPTAAKARPLTTVPSHAASRYEAMSA
jgi:hypothetical protein